MAGVRVLSKENRKMKIAINKVLGMQAAVIGSSLITMVIATMLSDRPQYIFLLAGVLSLGLAFLIGSLLYYKNIKRAAVPLAVTYAIFSVMVIGASMSTWDASDIPFTISAMSVCAILLSSNVSSLLLCLGHNEIKAETNESSNSSKSDEP
jgi:hypothetical protein